MSTAARIEILIGVLGWQGGTAHQVAEATGCSAEDLMGPTPEDTSLNSSYSSGWFSARTCSLEHNSDVVWPKRHGDVDFWIGAADGKLLDLAT